MAYVNPLGYYELYINGKKADDHVLSPAVSDYSKRNLYAAHEVADYLVPGKNVMALWLGRGWYVRGHPGVIHEGPLVRAHLNISMTDGSAKEVVTDETWKLRESHLTPPGRGTAFGDYGGEIWDAARDLPGWNAPGLDDASWQTAAVFEPPQVLTAAQEYRVYDPSYGQECLAAGIRCWKANPRDGVTRDLGWWLIAAIELARATKDSAYAAEAARLAQLLVIRQQTSFAGNQRRIRGYFQVSATDRFPYTDAVYSAIPAIALLQAATQFPTHPAAPGWRDAVRMYLDEYVTPLSERSAFRIVPFGVFHVSPTPELYRPLGGELTYRYFLPVRKQFWWLGTTSHLELHAALLGMAAQVLDRREYRDLAYRQLKWVMGANPFGACLMTGEGMRNVYPHSRYVGLLNGGIVNGIAGNAKDEPILDTEYGYDWRTTEYWSPHNAWYLWALSQLERA